MSPEQEAARNLIQRALKAKEQGEADILIQAAQRLDRNIDAKAIAEIWLEQWLEENKNRNQAV
jgi:hypothetical protein